MTTSGSSGRKGLFVYDRAGVGRLIAAQFLRYSAIAGIRPRLPRGCGSPRSSAPNGAHMSRRVAQTARRRAAPRACAAGDAADGGARRAPERASSPQSHERLPVDRRAAGRGAAAGPPADRPDGRSRPAASCRRRRWPSASRRRSACGPTTSTRRPKACGAATANEHAGIHLFEDMTHRRERRRGRPARARRRARRAAARDEPVQPRAAADPPRARRRRHARRRTVPLRAHAAPHGARSPAAATTCSSCRRRRARVAVHPLQFGVVAARSRGASSSRSCRRARACGCCVVARGDGADARDAAARGARGAPVRARRRRAGHRGRAPRPRSRAQPGGKLQLVVADRSARETSKL